MFGGGGFFSGFGGPHDEEDFSEEHTGDSGKELDNQEFYKILGVAQTATEAEIKKAFRQASMKGDYRHPDRGGDVNKFQTLNQAYQVLNDPNKKKLYDKYGQEAALSGAAPSSGGMGDLLSQLFNPGGGGGKPQQRKCKPKGVEMKITLEEAYKGGTKVVEVPRKRPCAACDGKGGKDAKVCPGCKGRKMVTKMVMLGPGMYSQSTQPCGECRGEGMSYDEKNRCQTCKGVCIVDEKKQMDVTIEPGVPDQHQITYTGEGDEAPGIMAGDVIFVVKIQKNKEFERKGADLYITKKISLLQALTGVNFQITHLDGAKFTVTTFPGEVISHGETKTIKQKGMSFFKDAMSYGNLYVKFNIEFPKKGTLKPEQIEALAQILPGPRSNPLEKGAKTEYLEDFDENETNSRAEGGNKQTGGLHGHHEDEDDEDGGGHHGPGVQCNQQ